MPPLTADQPAPAPAGAVLRGLVDGAAASPFDVVLRLSPDGRSIERMNLTMPFRCRGGGRSEDWPYLAGGRVNDGGTFRVVVASRTATR